MKNTLHVCIHELSTKNSNAEDGIFVKLKDKEIYILVIQGKGNIHLFLTHVKWQYGMMSVTLRTYASSA
jgi:hypothetical protein